MALSQGVVVEQLQGGLNRLAVNTDSHFAYFTGVDQFVLHPEGRVVKSVYDAEQLAINAAFDANNASNLYEGIQDFFRLAPDGVLYLFPVANAGSNYMKERLLAFKEIKGYAFNSINNPLENPSNIELHQTLINELKSQNRLIDFAILGSGTFANISQNLFELECPNVSVCISKHSTASNDPALLPLLGMLAVRQVSENLGSVDILNKPLAKRGRQDYPLTDNLLNRFTQPSLTDGVSMDAVPQDYFDELREKGYIMVTSYQGYPGYFFENSYTCVERSSDFAFIENNRVWNKAARIVRATLIPRVKSKVKKDPQTGFIAATTTSYWEGLVSKAMEQMIISNDISGFEVSIDNKQVVDETNPVKIKLLVVKDAIAHSFEVALGLTNNL